MDENPGRMQLVKNWWDGRKDGRDQEGGYRVLEVTFITVWCAQFSRLYKFTLVQASFATPSLLYDRARPSIRDTPSPKTDHLSGFDVD